MMNKATAMHTPVDYQQDKQVVTLTLNRPKARNAFNQALRKDLLAAVQRANADNQVRVVVLTGAGIDFSAGTDVKEPSPASVEALLLEQYKPVLMAIYNAPKPYIAAVNGAAAGIGSAFMLACDLVIMAEDAYCYQAFVPIGLIPDGGLSWHLVHQLGRKRAYQFIVEGGKLTAEQCVQWGLANKYVAAETLLAAARQWAQALAGKAPLALGYAKQALNNSLQQNLDGAFNQEAVLQASAAASADAQEGVAALLAKRPPVFVGK